MNRNIEEKQEDKGQRSSIAEENEQSFPDTDSVERLLRQAYTTESVPEEWNIRLKNQLICQQAARGKGLSLWWLPAVTASVVSGAMAAIFFLLYVLMNIGGASSWMPNLLQRISDVWLVLHLVVLVLEIVISWIITLVGVWKSDLVSNTRLF